MGMTDDDEPTATFRAMDADRKARRAKRTTKNETSLASAELHGTVRVNRLSEHHVRVEVLGFVKGPRLYDFWPTTGRFRVTSPLEALKAGGHGVTFVGGFRALLKLAREGRVR